MFKSWYSNFYNQLTKFSNNNNNNSNTFTRKNNTNSNNNDNCEFKNSQNNLSQVVYFNMATNNQSKPNKSKFALRSFHINRLDNNMYLIRVS